MAASSTWPPVTAHHAVAGGTVIPHALSLHAAVAAAPAYAAHASLLDPSIADLGPGFGALAQGRVGMDLRSIDVHWLSEPAALWQCALHDPPDLSAKPAHCSALVNSVPRAVPTLEPQPARPSAQPAHANGVSIISWFQLELGGGVVLGSSCASKTHWRQLVTPVYGTAAELAGMAASDGVPLRIEVTVFDDEHRCCLKARDDPS